MKRFSTSLLGEAKTLLLATDGSKYSDGAVQEAIFFGQACRAKVVILHVIKINAESLRSADSAVRKRREELTDYLDILKKMARDGGVTIETVIIGADHPGKAIIEQARMRKADVILMGRHGKAGRLSLLIGRMTARVLDLGFPRVLVVPKDFLISGSHVLLATDDSPGAVKAVEEAISLGRRNTMLQQLTIMSVAKQQSDIPRLEKAVNALCLRVKEAGAQIDCTPLVQLGDPAKLIVEAARERQTDMILIGGRGKRSMTRMLLGQVTKNVTGAAHCAVLVINT